MSVGSGVEMKKVTEQVANTEISSVWPLVRGGVSYPMRSEVSALFGVSDARGGVTTVRILMLDHAADIRRKL